MDEYLLVGAEKLAEEAIQAGIEKCRAKDGPPAGFDGSCKCGEDVDPRRIALGYYRCLDCQTRLERRR
jgi:hypothetical protein